MQALPQPPTQGPSNTEASQCSWRYRCQGAQTCCVQAAQPPVTSQTKPFGIAEAADVLLRAAAQARLDQVAGGQVPYNAVTGGSIGPGGSGKTQTHRSVMGEPFVEGAGRSSTVGADKMMLEMRQSTTKMLDLQRAKALSLLERTVRAAVANNHAATQSIEQLVDTDACRAEVRA